MANFVLVSPSSGFGNAQIKVKPINENTSTTDEKKGKLVIKVNGEVQRTIPLSQAIKGSSGDTPSKEVTSYVLQLDIQDQSSHGNTGISFLPTSVVINSPHKGYESSIKIYYRNPTSSGGNTSLSFDSQGIMATFSGTLITYYSDGSSDTSGILPTIGKTDIPSSWGWNPSKPDGNVQALYITNDEAQAGIYGTTNGTGWVELDPGLKDTIGSGMKITLVLDLWYYMEENLTVLPYN